MPGWMRASGALPAPPRKTVAIGVAGAGKNQGVLRGPGGGNEGDGTGRFQCR